jgi:hypothetical protein
MPLPNSWQIALRVALALGGGYLFVRSGVAFSIAGLARLGVDYDSAWALAMMHAFLLYLVLLLWAFAARHLARVGLVLIGGALLLGSGAHWLAAGV